LKAFLDFSVEPINPIIKNGLIIAGIAKMFIAGPEITNGSNPTRPAAVVVGIPMEPKVGGVAFAIKHATAEKRGLKPRATIIAAGIATAVPKPATPSMNPPKPHAKINTRTRLSFVTDVNMLLINSMALVSTQRLYANIAAMMIKPIGQIAPINPSMEAVTDSPTVKPTSVSSKFIVLKITLSTIEISNAVKHPM